MATVTFYEKTGCSGNARQKALLVESGHRVEARDLRHTSWTNTALLAFLGGLPVTQWFNLSAPAIKSGEIVPEELDEAAALALLRDNPLLIRRPLLQVGEERKVGFDATAMHAWIGLTAIPDGNLEGCPHPAAEPCVFYVQTGSGGAMPCRFDKGATDAACCPP